MNKTAMPRHTGIAPTLPACWEPHGCGREELGNVGLRALRPAGAPVPTEDAAWSGPAASIALVVAGTRRLWSYRATQKTATPAPYQRRARFRGLGRRRTHAAQ